MPAPKPLISKEVLESMYRDQQMSISDIVAAFGMSSSAVRRQLKIHSISLRARTEAVKISWTQGKLKKAELNCKVLEEVTCRKCGAMWKPAGVASREICPFCGRGKDVRDRRGQGEVRKRLARMESLKGWAKVDENRKRSRKRLGELLRKRVFFRITGKVQHECARCGCDDSRLLEVNHKNGGGNKEVRPGGKSKAKAFYYSIAKGERLTEDLELLCKPCNAIHYLELKYGELPMKVVWGPQNG